MLLPKAVSVLIGVHKTDPDVKGLPSLKLITRSTIVYSTLRSIEACLDFCVYAVLSGQTHPYSNLSNVHEGESIESQGPNI